MIKNIVSKLLHYRYQSLLIILLFLLLTFATSLMAGISISPLDSFKDRFVNLGAETRYLNYLDPVGTNNLSKNFIPSNADETLFFSHKPYIEKDEEVNLITFRGLGSIYKLGVPDKNMRIRKCETNCELKMEEGKAYVDSKYLSSFHLTEAEAIGKPFTYVAEVKENGSSVNKTISTTIEGVVSFDFPPFGDALVNFENVEDFYRPLVLIPDSSDESLTYIINNSVNLYRYDFYNRLDSKTGTLKLDYYSGSFFEKINYESHQGEINKILLIYALTLISTCFVVMIVYDYLMEDEVQELGTKLTCGVKRKHLVLEFLLEFLILGIPSAIIGALGGLGTAMLFSPLYFETAALIFGITVGSFVLLLLFEGVMVGLRVYNVDYMKYVQAE